MMGAYEGKIVTLNSLSETLDKMAFLCYSNHCHKANRPQTSSTIHAKYQPTPLEESNMSDSKRNDVLEYDTSSRNALRFHSTPMGGQVSSAGSFARTPP